jgi:hypothetical protein
MHVRGVAALATLALLGCADASDGEPTTVELVELVEEQEGFDGRHVVARGVVRTYDDPRHYWIEDADQHRVELVPEELVSPHVGDEIEVTGRFTFRDDEGRRIAIEELEVLSDGDADPA